MTGVMKCEIARLRARVEELERALETRGDVVRAAAGLDSGPACDEILALRVSNRALTEALRGIVEDRSPHRIQSIKKGRADLREHGAKEGE